MKQTKSKTASEALFTAEHWTFLSPSKPDQLVKKKFFLRLEKLPGTKYHPKMTTETAKIT